MNDFDYNNEILEINDETKNLSFEELIKQKSENASEEVKRAPSTGNKFSKKQKIIILILCLIIFLMGIGLVLCYIFRDNEEENVPDDPIVIIEKENYRYENGTLVFLNINEKEIGNYECINKEADMCYVTKIDLSSDSFDRVISINENNEEVIKTSKIYNDKYVFVTDGDIVYLYNILTKEKELELKSIKEYSTNRNIIVVENDKNLYGLLEIKEDSYEYLIRPSYDNLGMVNPSKELLFAQDKDKHYIINTTGKVLSKDIKVEVKSANETYIVGISNETYNLYNYNYEELLSDYDYISLHDDVISLVKSKKLYLVDSNLNKLYEDGIRLSSSDYNKKYVYNDNKLVETKKSYEIDIQNNVINVTIDNNIKKINMLEGAFSSNLHYMSYYDGKLYFYGDEEKIDVIGTYTCNNKNTISRIEDGLENCYLYKSDKGISGIYNNEYVIIYDNDSSNSIYYLYNLKAKKSMGTYSDIKIVNYNEINSNVKPIYTSESYIIAKSATGPNKGNYGVLEINSEKVQGKIGFNYQSIEKSNEYYILLHTDNSYSLYNTEFSKISNEFEYIKMYDNYYVGINNKKLNIYSYTSTLSILENDINISNNDFSIDFTDGFIITIDGIEYKYDKLGKKIENEADASVEDSEEEYIEEENNEE